MSLQSLDSLSDSGVLRVNELCNQFEEAWNTERKLSIEALLSKVADAERSTLLMELIPLEIELRQNVGDAITLDDYVSRFPGLSEANVRELAREFADEETQTSGAVLDAPTLGSGDRIDRYVLGDVLGSGGFGVVYKAWDEELHRDVALKLPITGNASQQRLVSFLSEARTLAALDHPSIVPVFDSGTTPQGDVFIVSKLIHGTQLSRFAERIKGQWLVIARIVADIADALHHGHLANIYHRDIKPANVLVDESARVYVTDFGLALRENETTGTGRLVGTPAYMSPEQARGESHRIDGRSDIFSLGVVMYELLAGRRPFRGDTRKVLSAIKHHEPRPPRQIDDTVPRELERVCLKALSKRISERYSTAADLATELREWLEGTTDIQAGSTESVSAPVAQSRLSSQLDITVIPRGLRSFDEDDAGFFLQLIPGPRGVDGLPDCLRFWKSRIESTDPNRVFSAGVLYGPSGAGKSSLIRAGLLPLLGERITPIVIEGSAGKTEQRLLTELQRAGAEYDFPTRSDTPELTGLITQLRRSGSSSGNKYLIVIDQFEQWLHASTDFAESELVDAIRQCDGLNVQCLLLIRDDFWLSLSRFMQAIEVDLVPGRNVAVFDLFDANHAAKVLKLFGQAFQRLPSGSNTPTESQSLFVDKAIEGLAVDGRVVPVQLSLFAEMMKGREWCPEALERFGGMKGLGVTFLDESLSSSTAMPHHRVHLDAARRVLTLLLPESGNNIKGRVRSHQDLFRASRYTNEDRFNELLRILDTDLRLITPVDNPGEGQAGRDYQLTHDYAVPPLREWLYRKQKETRRGRAEIKLSERAAEWQARPEKRNLASLREFLQFGLFTRHTDRTDSERAFVRASSRRHLLLGCVVVLLGVTAFFVNRSISEKAERKAADQIVLQIEGAALNELPPLFRKIRGNTDFVPLLSNARQDAISKNQQSRRRNLSLALVEFGETDTQYFLEQLLAAPFQEISTLMDQLAPATTDINPHLWEVFSDKTQDKEKRLRAALALGQLADENARELKAVSIDINRLLLNELATNPHSVDATIDLFESLSEILTPPATAVAQEHHDKLTAANAARMVAKWNADNPAALSSLALLLQPAAYKGCKDTLLEQAEEIIPTMSKYADKWVPKRGMPDRSYSSAAENWTQLVSLLFVLGSEKRVWNALADPKTDPLVRDNLVFRLPQFQPDLGQLIERLKRSENPIESASIIRMLPSYPVGLDDREINAELVRRMRTDRDAQVHAASEWLLMWRRNLVAVTQTKRALVANPLKGADWFVDPFAQTMITIRMKSDGVKPFAVSATEVQVGLYHRLATGEAQVVGDSLDFARPQTGVSWYDAAEFCNRLSEAAGINKDQWCYLPNDEGKYAEGMRIAPNATERSGYRLPTEAEWLLAAGARESGQLPWDVAARLSDRYAWSNIDKSPLLPVGLKHPNTRGLFDTAGNAAEWCHPEGNSRIDDKTKIPVRGGSTLNTPMQLMSIPREIFSPGSRPAHVGFRVTRTISPQE